MQGTRANRTLIGIWKLELIEDLRALSRIRNAKSDLDRDHQQESEIFFRFDFLMTK